MNSTTSTKTSNPTNLLVASTVTIVASTTHRSPDTPKHVSWPDKVAGTPAASSPQELPTTPPTPKQTTSIESKYMEEASLQELSATPLTSIQTTNVESEESDFASPNSPISPSEAKMYSPPSLVSLLEQATQRAVGRTSTPGPDFLLSETLPNHSIIHFRPAHKDDLDGMTEVLSQSAKVTPLNRWMFPKQRQYPQDHERLNRAYLEHRFHDPKVVFVVAEFAGRTPGSAAVAGSLKGMQKKIVGMVEIRWGGKVKNEKNEGGKTMKVSRVPVSKTQFGAIFQAALSKPSLMLAWELNRSKDRARTRSLEKAEFKHDKEIFDEDLEDHWQIDALIVHPEFEHKGIGSRLLSLVLEACCEQRQEPVCLTAIPGKKDFYLKRGMSQYGEFEHETGKWLAMFKQAEGKETAKMTIE